MSPFSICVPFPFSLRFCFLRLRVWRDVKKSGLGQFHICFTYVAIHWLTILGAMETYPFVHQPLSVFIAYFSLAHFKAL